MRAGEASRYSISFTGAAGLPMRKPPSGVRTTVSDQSRAAGAAACAGPRRCASAIPAGANAAAAASRAISARALHGQRPIAERSSGSSASQLAISCLVPLMKKVGVPVDSFLIGGMVGHVGDLLDRGAIGEACVETRRRHAAPGEEGVETDRAGERRGLLLGRQRADALALGLVDGGEELASGGCTSARSA